MKKIIIIFLLILFYINCYADDKYIASVKIGEKWIFIDIKENNYTLEYIDKYYYLTDSNHVTSFPQSSDCLYCKSYNNDFVPMRVGPLCWDYKCVFTDNESKWGYGDDNETFYIKAKYDFAYPFSEGLAAVSVNGKIGFINKKDEMVITPQFDMIRDHFFRLGFYPEIVEFRNGLAAVYQKDPKHISFGFIDKTGKYVIERKFGYAHNFNEDGTAPAVLDDKKWGLINKKGDFVVKPQFQSIRPFAYGYAAVKVNDKWGYIDTKGKIVIEPKYDDARDFVKKLISKQEWYEKNKSEF